MGCAEEDDGRRCGALAACRQSEILGEGLGSGPGSGAGENPWAQSLVYVAAATIGPCAGVPSASGPGL